MERDRSFYARKIALFAFVTCSALAVSCGDRTGLDSAIASSIVNEEDAGSIEGGAPSSCDAGSATAYALDGSGILYRFDLGSSVYKIVATPDCGNFNVPWTMTASEESIYIVYTDWTIYQVDLTTFACTQTSFVTGSSGSKESSA